MLYFLLRLNSNFLNNFSVRFSCLQKQIIKNFYGEIIDGVELDIKIVNPNDQEKKKMVDKMLKASEIKPKKPKTQKPIRYKLKRI